LVSVSPQRARLCCCEGGRGVTFDRNEWQRRYRRETGNAQTLKYERTKHGKLVRIYRNMKSRIEGVQRQKFHLYRGKYLLPKEEFYVWALMQPEFHRLYSEWVESG